MPRWPKRNPRPGVDEYGRSPLWYFASDGDMAGINAELAAGADPSAGDDVGYTPLHVAVQNGEVHAVEALLAAGANANATDSHAHGPLWVAVHYACLASRTDANLAIVRLLLDRGANPDHVDNHDWSPRKIAEQSSEEVVSLLSQ